MDAIHYLTIATTGEVSPAYTEVKQSITTKYDSLSQETYATWCMARRMKNYKMQVTNIYTVPTL